MELKNIKRVISGPVFSIFNTCLFVILINLLFLPAGCGEREKPAEKKVQSKLDKELISKYGKAYNDLPSVKLVIISPHNTDIQKEYERAFSVFHATEYGERVEIEWRDVGGGSTAILNNLRNIYGSSDSSGIDIVWGGGDFNFKKMAEEGILQKMRISDDILKNIPYTFGGLHMYDKEKRWCGSAISGFGFLFNVPLLKQLKVNPPARWEDLGEKRFFGLIGLADPTQSGSAAASYEMIVQSAENWQAGWARLLSILGNSRRIYAGAGDAAEALPSGEVAVASCIDYYGINRVIKYPKTLKYVSPKGETAFNPDPIAILKNPPNPKLAQRMVDFVLSIRGQALWALPAGDPDGPLWASLGRLPIRKDVYEIYSGRLMPEIINPYDFGQSMNIDSKVWDASYGLLRQLVWAAAVRNLDGLKTAKQKLIKSNLDEGLVKEFNTLPQNVSTIEKVAETAELLRDAKKSDIIVTDWIRFFKDKYDRITD